jgi:hypothetical protein
MGGGGDGRRRWRAVIRDRSKVSKWTVGSMWLAGRCSGIRRRRRAHGLHTDCSMVPENAAGGAWRLRWISMSTASLAGISTSDRARQGSQDCVKIDTINVGHG